MSGTAANIPMELKSLSFYEFGPYRLEPVEHRLLRDGQPVSLTPKAFELLLYLVENHGRLVLKDQIMKAVWPGSFVEESNLTVCISALRKALGKDDTGLQYIETVPKKGYRFAVPVMGANTRENIRSQLDEPVKPADPELQEPAEVSAPLTAPVASRKHRHSRVTISVIAVLSCVITLTAYLWYRKTAALHGPPLPRSLAILPLQNLQHDSDYDFLGYSLADAVITKLSTVRSLTVRPSSAVEKYKGQTIDLPRVVSELKVDTILTGNFIRDGDQLRIT
ncbi:MAG: winged helix-turn-helix domain-containing protein, partial [Acidobacteriaceae bacterium]|nr:winged helix-turn-helix domain-containing protein [Acidobacteriaceae bacterium]